MVSTTDMSILKNISAIHSASFYWSTSQVITIQGSLGNLEESSLSSRKVTLWLGDIGSALPCFLGYVLILPVSITSCCLSGFCITTLCYIDWLHHASILSDRGEAGDVFENTVTILSTILWLLIKKTTTMISKNLFLFLPTPHNRIKAMQVGQRIWEGGEKVLKDFTHKCCTDVE